MDLERATEKAFEALGRAGNDPRALESPWREVAVVVAAQGVLDNGGFRYFFGNDWPVHPSYDLFIDAYRRIGADPVADALERAVALFPFPAPERSTEARLAFLRGPGGEAIDACERAAEPCDPWARLEAYVRDHAAAFG